MLLPLEYYNRIGREQELVRRYFTGKKRERDIQDYMKQDVDPDIVPQECPTVLTIKCFFFLLFNSEKLLHHHHRFIKKEVPNLEIL